MGNNFQNIEEDEVVDHKEKEEQTELAQHEIQNVELENNELIDNLEDNSKKVLNEENKEISASPEFSEQVETKNSVKRLSLFDSLNEKSTSEKTVTALEESKSEPVFENQADHEDSQISDSSLENEIDPEEISDDKEFNQENDEELLDIPTFLRRQAN